MNARHLLGLTVLSVIFFGMSPTSIADGFLLQDTGYSILDAPGSSATEPLSINDTGEIVGTYFNAAGSSGFIDSGGVLTSITFPGSQGGTFLQGVNNEGEIVGTSNTIGFVYSGGTFTPLPNQALDPFGINDLGQISGYYYDSSGTPHGFLLTGNTILTLNDPNGGETFAFGINDFGEIVGQSVTIGGPESGFLYNHGVFTTISCPGAYATLPFGINNLGEIVGICESVQGIQGFVDVNGQFTLLSDPSYGHTEAYGINDLNQITGAAYFPLNTPEPSTIQLLAAGLLGLIAMGASKRWARHGTRNSVDL